MCNSTALEFPLWIDGKGQNLWSIQEDLRFLDNHNDISTIFARPQYEPPENTRFMHLTDARANLNRICIISHLIFAKYVSIWLTHSGTQFIPIDLNVMHCARVCLLFQPFSTSPLSSSTLSLSWGSIWFVSIASISHAYDSLYRRSILRAYIAYAIWHVIQFANFQSTNHFSMAQ